MRATLDHFEIPVADSELVAAFLEAVFGWARDGGGRSSNSRYQRLAAAAVEPGSSEATMRVGLFEGPSETLDRAMPVVRLTGEPLEVCLERVTAAGGRVLLEPREVGDTGRFAHFEDPEGNPWGLWQALSPAGGRPD